ncbi:YetF domain-containing protein [Streptosporangium soli]|nr:DUF421 domain-containing protein [Streptosporangium sp. KLBMP 9127]
MWQDLWELGIPAPEKIIRTVLVYAAIAVLLRLAGKRELAQLNTLDLVVVLLLSNVVQNAVIGPDNSLVGGLLGAVVLVGVNAVTVRFSVVATERHPRLARWLEGTPTMLIRDGQIDAAALSRVGLRRGDVLAALRRQGAEHISDVEAMVLAPGGTLLVRLKPEEEAADRADIDSLRHQLARIQATLDDLQARALHR